MSAYAAGRATVLGLPGQGLGEGQELGRRLGLRLPAPSAIHIFAVEVEDVATFSERMTLRLEARYPGILDGISREVRPCSSSRGPPTAPRAQRVASAAEIVARTLRR
jgi:hypothetical protein